MKDFSKMLEDFLQNFDKKVIKTIDESPFQSPIAAKPLKASGEAASLRYNTMMVNFKLSSIHKDTDRNI